MSDYNFDDVEPVKINEEYPQLCQILYDEEYTKTMGILLALLQKSEYSERAFFLTQKGIELLASHYTIWIYRFDILIHLNKDLFEELDWCEQIALENEKNYQIWNYRQLVISRIVATTDKSSSKKFEPHREFPILEAMLDSDPKNHHVWAYRKWFVEKFALYDDSKENEFVNGVIAADLRNNSAWSHRFFLKFSQDKEINKQVFEAESEFVQAMIADSPQNPSTWNYLTGMYNKYKQSLSELEEFCLKFVQFVDGQVQAVESSYALEVLAKIYEVNKTDTSVALYDALALKYDPIRVNYWNYQKRNLPVAQN
ncbi:protein farnesyltransferase / geranylgeranyltransferase type I alpha subunit [Scheffersomyces stipitis CBS 6054]|uniref:Protein farnesyltransferase/geranylgeranyltransferase type-1 subunit alpha n=1 Tax=Scheffersomyces stipitis (strain ATCC 58785 / CBS 6054 / NBRC 10063 / NRRL Y-11545) TaxID=322104 RepID=A3LQ88_PICST|nr:protein farnesyltransferase / geranylgeranyltransferase type I alpha subunit [Scheffersomyces stipitis CBS 6054]ABN64639.2 protein farnesyltransferase / geranylgeranyltransferase type I alpha subunit [Scheffersomyces stipitis CBS 6054]